MIPFNIASKHTIILRMVNTGDELCRDGYFIGQYFIMHLFFVNGIIWIVEANATQCQHQNLDPSESRGVLRVGRDE